MDNIRPAGFGILNRNPHVAVSPAHSQIWENVCLSQGYRRHAQCDNGETHTVCAEPGRESQSQRPIKGGRTAKGKGWQADTPMTVPLTQTCLDDSMAVDVLLKVKNTFPVLGTKEGSTLEVFRVVFTDTSHVRTGDEMV